MTTATMGTTTARSRVQASSPMRTDDADTLYAVLVTPFATARHLTKLWQLDTERRVYRSLARLRGAGYVQTVGYRDPHGYDNTTVNLHFVTRQGVAAAERDYDYEHDELYASDLLVSAQWQRHLSRHLDTVTQVYDYAVALKRLTGKRPNWHFPRQGSFDAWLWADFKDGLSLGFIRMGPTLGLSQLVARISALRGGDDLTCRHDAPGGRRGPGMVLVSVPTEIDKQLVSEWFALSGRFGWGTGIQGLVATAFEARRGFWYSPRAGGVVDIDGIAGFTPTPSTYNPKIKDDYAVAKPVPVRELPAPLSPVQSRILDALFAWPLMRPTEIAPVLGVAYSGSLNEHLADLTERGLIKDIRELVAAQLVSYNIREYRDRPLVLTDAGLLHLGARDRARSGRYRKGDGKKVEREDKKKKRDRTTLGLLDRWGTEGVNKGSGKRFLGGDIGKMTREMAHTLGVNNLVSRMCKDLPYTPEALPDHLNRRYYKTSKWAGDDGSEYLVRSSVAPDAALILRDGDRRRTVLLEYERSAAEGGGKALTRKVQVWAEYAKRGGRKYVGHELVCFIVPTDRARDNLVRRIQLVQRRYGRTVETVVTTESDFEHANNVMTAPIWTLATDPAAPTVFIDLAAVPDAKP